MTSYKTALRGLSLSNSIASGF